MENKTIYSKLLQFQKLGISVIKDGKNEFFKKPNGQASKYCTLNEVLDKVKKPLNDLGIVIIFEPQETGLKTILHDTETNTEISGFMKYVDCGNAQKLLACNTYFRRGSLVSILGLEDEDDDGNAASKPNKEPQQKTEPNQKEIDKAFDIISNSKTLSELSSNWDAIGKVMRLDKEILAKKEELKKILK